MRSKLLVTTASLALALSACKKESVDGPLAGCMPVSFTSYCASDAECCSYGCVLGRCMPNPLEGGVCLTHGDCESPRLCVENRCTSATCNAGGACSPTSGAPCCVGACTTGTCAPDRPPVVVIGREPATVQVPWRVPVQLTNDSYDPDGGGLTFLWEVVSGPPVTFDPLPNWPDPRVIPGAIGTTVLRLTARSTGQSASATLTFEAVNTPPAIDMPPDVPVSTYVSRNVPFQFDAGVSDADGGPISCTWSKKGPTAPQYTVVSGPVVCAGASGAAATGRAPMFTLNEDEAGTWEVRLVATDGVNTVSASRFVSVQNDPPVASAGPKRYGNYSMGPIPIHATATDPNHDVTNGNQGDATFEWAWFVSTAPAGSALQGTALPQTTPSISFLPDREGTYFLTLTVDDHHGGPRGGTSSDTVEVRVDPFIRDLGEVAAAEYVDGSNRVVVADTDGGSHLLKIVDPATLEVEFVVTLAARPTAIALDPAGHEALVAEAGGRWEKVTGIQAIPSVVTTVPATAGVALPADLSSVAYAGATCAYGTTAGGSVYVLKPDATAAPYWVNQPASGVCPSCTAATELPSGTRAVTATATVGTTTAPWLWLLHTGTGRLGRYEIQTSNCNLRPPALLTDGVLQGTAGLWLSADGADLFTTRSKVYAAAAATLTPRVHALPLVPDHLRTTLVSSSLVGAVAQASTSALATFGRAGPDTAFSSGGTRDYPIRGYDGDPRQNTGRYAFVRSGGGEFYAIVRANVGTDAAPVWKWGLVNLGP